MLQIDATILYYTDHFRTWTSHQLRHAIASGLPWPEHIAAHSILRERARRLDDCYRQEKTTRSLSFSEVVRRILGGIVLSALRAFASARSSPPRSATRISHRPAISSVRILGKVPATPLRTHARVGERPHNAAT